MLCIGDTVPTRHASARSMCVLPPPPWMAAASYVHKMQIHCAHTHTRTHEHRLRKTMQQFSAV